MARNEMASPALTASPLLDEQRVPVQVAAVSGDAEVQVAPYMTFGKSLRTLSSRFTPTNVNMLLFRTMNRDEGRPNANQDYIAPLFRDRLIPVRAWVQRNVWGMQALTRRGIEDPVVGVPGVINFVDARTKWVDSVLAQALEEGFDQVVCIAAGYDTRAYRFHRPGVKFYEVDLPSASTRKQALVKAVLPGPDVVPRPTYVAADLSRVTLNAALGSTDFDAGRRTLLTCEGLIYYLPEAAVSTLLASVADLAAPGSRMCFDFLHADALEGASYVGYHACAESVAGKGEAFISGLVPEEEDLAAYLAPLNWGLKRLYSPREMVAAQLPHEAWSDEQPPICSYYSYCEVEKPVA